jgi:hypothetical protein
MNIADYQWYAENFLSITTKDSRLVPFKLNGYQRRLYRLVEKLRAEDKPVRIIVLKARQMGISTFCAGSVFHAAATNFYTKSMLVAHDIDSSVNLFTMVKRMYDFMPDRIKPMSRYSNRRELVFENSDEATRGQAPGLLSSIEIETANKSTAGRSGTIHHLHISELAFWNNAINPMNGLLQAVPNKPGTSVFIESTANGIVGDGETFHQMWMKAKAGENDFVPFFIPWFENPEYSMQTLGDEVWKDNEIQLANAHGLTNEQISWRRWKIRNDFAGDETLFNQEFPASAEESFLVSGRPVFNIAMLMKKMHGLNETPRIDEAFKIFKEPEPGKVYCIGADTAEGLEQGDYSTAFVIDREFNQMASMRVHMDTDHFADALIKLAKMYNGALITWELNNHGHAVLSRLKDKSYYNLYTREDFDEMADKRMKKLGWQTNVKTKQLMLDEFRAAVRDSALNIRDAELYKEMMTLVYEPDGNIILNGKDLVVAACLAIQGLKQTPQELKYKALSTAEDDYITPKPESFLERQKRLARKGDSYFQ